MAWVESGLDVRYDEAFRTEVAAARDSDEDFEAILEAHCYMADLHANMDW